MRAHTAFYVGTCWPAGGNWYRIAARPCGPYEAGAVYATNQMDFEEAKIARYLGR
jgi:hypothetical protein